MVWLLFIVFIVLIFIGFPVAFALGLSSLFYLFAEGIPLSILPQKMYVGIDSFVLVSIPGFILAGNLMNSTGMTKRIIKFANAIIGRIRGGLGLANVLASVVFAGISGTALADVASLGGVLIPAMKDEGYDADFSVAVTVGSSTIGPIIPPSLPMIIAGTLTGISVSRLFVAGVIPGLLMGLLMMIYVYRVSIKRNYPKAEKMTYREALLSFKDAIWAILMTFIILFGILGGYFTPTEASIIAVVYALLVGKFVYKELDWKNVPKIIVDSVRMTASIMVLVGFANVFAWIMASERIPQMVADGILSISDNPIIVILLINVLLLFVGMFMETIAALVILFPVLLPLAISVGMEPIQFGVMAVLNLMIGLSTPPVGVCLFVGSSIGKISLSRASVAVIPFILINTIVLLLIAFVPAVTMWLAGLL